MVLVLSGGYRLTNSKSPKLIGYRCRLSLSGFFTLAWQAGIESQVKPIAFLFWHEYCDID
jgi:hypothetical protein